MECFENLVGIYSGDCSCIDKDASESNFYILDDMQWSLPLEALDHSILCGDGGLIPLAQKALKQAITRFHNDAIFKIDNEYRKVFQKYTGGIGQLAKANDYEFFAGDSQGIRMTGKRGVIEIKSFGFFPAQSQDVTFIILKNNSTVIHEQEYSVTGGKINVFDLDLSLPLVDSNGVIKYEFLVTEIQGQVFNIKYKCGCTDDTYKKVKNWVDIEGVNGAETDEYTHGLVLDVVLTCDIEEMLCTLGKERSSKMVLERMLQMYAIQNLGSHFLKSTNINRYTALSKEQISGHMEKLQSEIEWRLDWLFARTDMTDGCWICDSSFVQRKSLII